MIKSAEGSVWRLYKITKPKAWRGGAQILEKEGDARLLDRCEANREWWAKHWQCEESVQNLDDKFWKNEELKKLEEASPMLQVCGLEKASRKNKEKKRDAMEKGRSKLAQRCSF